MCLRFCLIAPSSVSLFSSESPKPRGWFDIVDRTVVAPDVVQVTGVLVGHRVNQNLLHCGIHHSEHAKPDGQRADRRSRKNRRAHEPPPDELDIAAPGAGAPQQRRWERPLGSAVAQRVDKREDPKLYREDPTAG